MKKSLFKCKDNLNRKFPLHSAHEWYELGIETVISAMKEHLMIEHFDNFGIAVSSRDSQKRKELLIAYNELNSFLVSSLPLIATKAQIKHGIINEGEAELAISSSDITNMIYAKFGISQTKSGELIPVSEETNALTSKQVKYVLAHNTIIKQTNELRTVRLYSMENQRLKLGLAPSKKLFA